jgi:hypothetical protein
LSLTARNEEGNPAGAVVALQVVDKRILTLADEKTFRSMPAHFLLTTEIRRPEDLEYADFLLSDNDPARTTLDLLLGTQGWRRFAEQDPARFREKFKEDADRLLVAMGQTSPRETDFALKETQRLQEEIKERRQSLAAEKEGAEAALLAVRGNSEARAAAVTLDQYRAWFDRFHRQGVPILGGLLGLVMIAFLLLRRPRLFSRPMPFIVGTACAVLLVAVALFYPAWLDWSAPWRGVGGERRFALAEKS